MSLDCRSQLLPNKVVLAVYLAHGDALRVTTSVLLQSLFITSQDQEAYATAAAVYAPKTGHASVGP